MARHADLTHPYELDQIAAAAAPALLDLADAAPVMLPASVRRGPTPMEAAGAAAPCQIVFIEGNVPDLPDLLNGLAPGAQAVVLDPDQDGVQQIAAYLTSHNITDLAGIDLVAHGADGEIALGTATLSAATLADYQNQLGQIGLGLAPGGAIQIYGCDVAEDTAGVSFLDRVSQATGGANIAAASHLVGDAAGGGSFNLDINVGTIPAATPFTADALASYKGELLLSSAQLFMVYSDDGQGSSNDRLVQASINAGTLGSTTQLANGTITSDFNELRTVAFDAPLGVYYLSNMANQNGNDSELFEGTIGSAGAPSLIYNIGSTSNILVDGLAFSATNNEVYFSQQSYNFGVSPAVVDTINSGIYEFTPTASGAVTPTLVINAYSSLTGGGTLQGPNNLAIVPNTDQIIFGDSGQNAEENGAANIDVGNVLSHQWTTLAIPGSITGTGVNSARNLSVAVDATSATGGILFFTVANGHVAHSGIFSAGYTITGSGTTQSASINTVFTTLAAGAAADFPFDIVLNPTVSNGTVTGNGTFYISSPNGTIYAGNMASAGTLTAVGSIVSGVPATGLAYESLPIIAPSGGISYTQGTTVTLNSGLALANTDIQKLVSATVTVAAGDTLHYTSTLGIAGSFSSGTLTLSGTTTAANYQVALESITFSSTAAAGTQTVNWAASDGIVIGSATSNITIAAAIALTAAGTVSFTGGGAAVHLDSTTTVTDTGNISGATIEINTGFVTGDLINFTNMLPITGTYSSGTLTLSGSTTAANYQTALDSITYSFTPSNGDPTSGGTDATRTIAWSITDGSGTATATSTVDTTQSSSPLLYGQTIVETGILAASETVSAGVMTLKNVGGTVVGSITVGSSLVSNDFTLSTISGNTDIILNTVFGTYSSGVTLSANPTTIASTAEVSGTVTNVTGIVGPSGTAWTLVNDGTVSETGSGSSGIVLDSGGTVTNSASAAISAYLNGVYIFNGAGSVSNLGTIIDTAGFAIKLSDGGNVTNAAGGTLAGRHAGVFIDNATDPTVSNAGSIGASQAYGIWLRNDGTVINALGGSITGGYRVFDAAGIYLGHGGAVTNQSGASIGGLHGVYILNGAATVVNAGHLFGGDTTIGAGATYTGAAAYLGAGGSVTNQLGGTISGYDGVWGAHIAATVVNTGAILGDPTSGGAVGVYLHAGGSVTNQVGGTISGYSGVKASGAATVVNAGVIAGKYTAEGANGIFLGLGGSVTNLSTGTISGGNDGIKISGAPGTVINLGNIRTHDYNFGNAGVYLVNGGAVTNGASGGTISTAYILGYHYGVEFGAAAAGTLTNFGIISGNPGNPAVLMDTGTIINGPSGATSALLEGGDQVNAVLITGVATVINYARIIGVENPGDPNIYYGVRLSGTSGSISNLGAHALIENYVGVYARDNDTVTNGGTIASNYAGGRAALIFGGGTNRLIVDPGAAFIGEVSGGGLVTLAPNGITTVIGTANGVGTTTLELASGTSAGTLTGLGVDYVGFAAVTIDNLAQWTLAGSNTLGTGVTLTDSGVLTDSGSFDNAGLVTGAANGVVLTAGAQLTNQSGGTITGSAIGVSASGAATVVNAGVISGNATSAQASGIKAAYGGAITNQSGGTITGYRAVYLGGGSSTVVNAGSISGSSAPNYGAGILMTGGGAVTNLSGGVITGHNAIYASTVALTVTNAGSIGGNTANGRGVDLLFGGTLTNQTGGAISGGTDAVLFAAGHTNRLVIDPGAAFIGTVSGGNSIGAASISTLELASGASVGTLSGLGAKYIDFAQVTIDVGAAWQLSGSQTGFASLSNAGALTGGVTLGAGNFSVTNQPSGTITGIAGILFGAVSDGILIDSGTIIGTGGTAVSFGSGTNSMQLRPGALRIQGEVYGGAGTSTLLFASGASAGTLTGVGAEFSGFSQGTVVAGASWVLAGANTFADSPMTDAGTLSNTGLLVVGPQLGVTGTLLNTGSVSGYGGTAVSVASGGFVGNSGTGAITGGAGSVGYGVDAGSGGTGVYLSSGGVTNAAAISGGAGGASDDLGGGGGVGVDVVGGNLTNTAGGTIAGGDGGGGYYNTNVDSYGDGGSAGVGVNLTSGSVTNTTLATIVGGAGGGGPRSAAVGGVGVDVSGGSLTNQGTISGGAAGGIQFGALVGGGYGVVLTNGSVTNQGTIIGAAGGSSSAAGLFGVGGKGGGGITVSGGSLTNIVSATIIGGAGGPGKSAPGGQGGYGIAVSAGSVVNQGIIIGGAAGSATGTYHDAGGAGVYLDGGGFTNQGTIIGGNGVGRGGNGGQGVDLQAGTLINAGIIAGGLGTIAGGSVFIADAVFFTGAGRLIVDPGASFVGAVAGHAGASDVLELASASNAGTLAGFGTGIIKFASLVFDAGAQWTVAGNDSAIGLGTVGISGFTFGDTIDLTGFAATGETFASNALVLTAGTVQETVHIQGSFTTGNFVLTDVGSTATDITFQTAPLLYGDTIDEAGTIASETVTGGLMTLFNDGGTAVGTIIVGASLSSGDFILRPDGVGGTDVIVDTVFGTYSSGVTLLVNPTTIASTAIVDNTAASGAAVSGPGGTAWTLTNLGNVAETGAGAGVGIAFSAAGTIINSGGISGNATVSGGAGISLAAGGVVTNQSGGTISGGTGISAHTVATVVNAGHISGYATNGRGIQFYNGGVVTNLSSGVITGNQGVFGATSVVNAGTIIGNPTVAGGAGVDAGAGLSVTNQSGGVITGYQGIADQRTIAVSNYGSIGGNATASHGAGLYLILGATVVNHSGGVISGFTGAYIYAANVVNAGDIAGNATSGIGISLAHGSVLTNQSGGTISGGTDAVKFGNGGNSRLVDDPGAVFIGAVVAAGNATLELASGASAGTLSGLGSKYVGFSAVAVDTGARWTFSGGNTVVSGVTLTNSGTLTATGTLINAGTLTGNMLRLDGASLTNQAGGLVSAAYVYGVGTGGADGVVNSGKITSGSNIAIYLKAAGNVSNAAGALISGYAGGVKLKGIDASLGNLGLVVGTGSLDTSYGAYLRNGGLVTNGQSGAGTSTASIQGYYGLTFKSADTNNAYGTLINYGTVRGSGTATGVGALLSNGGTVVNGQGGATGALIEGSRYGVSSSNGPVSNDATIIATGTAGGDYGIAIPNAGSVGNIGTSALVEGYGGVLIGLDGTVTNAGTIASNQGASGVAVKFIGGGARLIDDPGAVFVGSIYGGSGGTAVLELASGSSAGTIVGLGTRVTNFTSLVFDGGAQWTVAGNDAANGLGTLGISGFTSGDTIELTGFIGDSRTFASGALVLGDGVGDYETLHIPGGFSTGDFHTAVAGGNTDVTFQVPPTIAAGGTVTFTGGGAPVVLDPTLAVSDPNGGGTPTGATIALGGPIVDGDTLNFGTLDGITGSYDDLTGTLTLTGTASALDYQAALESITYSFAPVNGDPTDGGDVTSRTISWTVADGVASSTTGSSTLDLVHVAPTMIVGGTVTFTGGGGAVALESGLTVSDPDSGGLLNSGTVHIVGFVSGDILSANTAGLPGITASYDATTGTLTLSGSDTLADYQAALDSVSYSFNPSNGDPTDGEVAGSRTIDWSINDGVANSTTGTSTLDLVYVAPTVTAGGTASYAAGGAAAILDPAISVSDPDSTGLLTSGIIAITGGTFIGDGDVLNADTAGTSISVSYDPTNEVLVLSGSDTLADYQAVLASVSFSSTTSDPTNAGANAARTISWSVDDGVEGSGVATSTLDLTHLPPVISGTVGGQATTDTAAHDPFGGVTITDPNTGQSETVTITLSNGLNGALSDPGIGALTNGTYTVSGTALAVTGAIEGLVFTPTDHQVAPGSTVTTTFTISATDSNGGTATNSTTSVVAVAANDAPAIAGMLAGQTTTDAVALHPFSGVSISDLDFGQTETATITLSNQADGTLSNLDGGVFNNGTYTVAGTSPAVTDAIEGLVFTPTAHQVTPGSTVTTAFTIAVIDTAGSTASNAMTSVIATAANDAPVISGAMGDQSTTDEAAISPFAGVSISDVDFGQTETVTVTLSVAANGTLANVDGGSYDGSTGVYSVTGTDAAVSLALDALVFTPTAHQVVPGATVTTSFTIAATDTAGGTSSNGTTTVTVTAVDDPASFSGSLSNPGVPIVLDTSLVSAPTPFSTLTVIDPDVGHSDTVTITLSNPAFATVTNLGGGSYDGETGVYSVTGTPVEVNAAIHALVVTPPVVLASGDIYVTSTNVTVDLVGTDGGPAPLNTILASAVQVLDVGTAPADNDAVSVSSDGTGFAAPIVGDTNEAVVTAPTGGDIFTLPTGYQAEFVGGSANVTLQDTSVGNAVLVGNTGNDLLIGGAANDSIVAGNGNNTLVGGSGTIALEAGDGNDSITTLADSVYTVTLGGGTDTVFASGSGTITGGTGSDLIDASGTGGSTSNTIVLQGHLGTVLGGAGNLTLLDGGAGDTIQAGSGATSVTLNGSLGRARGGTGTFTVLNQTASNTVIGGTAGTMFVTVGASAANSDVFGRAGDTNILDLGADALIGAGGGTSVVSIGGAGTQVYGASPPGGSLSVSIGAANALVFGLGDNTTVDATNAAATGARVFGGFSSIAADNGTLSIQSGADSLYAVTGGSNATINAGTGGLYAYIGTGSIAGSNVINGASAGALYVAFIGGAGSATVYGGEAGASVFGVDGSDVTYVDTLAGAHGALLVANGSAAGSETLDAAGSATNDSLFAARGNVSLVAGSGTDILDAGANTGSVGGAGTVVGGDTMMAGGGADLMLFTHGAFAGGAVVINFSSVDTIFLSGYNAAAGGNQAAMALAGATEAGANTTIALADGTHITFGDATTTQLQGHLFSS